MITAAQAREATKERLTKLAQEFIINEVAQAVQEAIDAGRFFVNVPLDNIPNAEAVGEEAERLLVANYGFDAKFNYYGGSPRPEQYIFIKWEEK